MASAGTAPARVPAPTSAPNAVAAARVVSGAKWFYWIAALSMVNSLVAVFGGNFHFVLGLGITSVVDEVARRAGSAGTVLDFVINGFVAGVFVVFGMFAVKSQKWAFYLGMGLYVLDGLLLLIGQDILSVGFHAYALFYIYRGLAAVNQVQAATPATMMSGGTIVPQ